MNPHIDQKIRSGEVCLGTWLASGSPAISELAAGCGLEWLLLDLEHGWLTETLLLPCLQAIGRQGSAAIVRVPDHDPHRIGRVLDWGADGVMVPHVRSASEAASLVAATRHQPRGTRGMSGSVRATNFGMGKHPASPLLFAQIECLEGIKNAAEISAVDGVDVLFVGPGDLAANLLALGVSEPVGSLLPGVVEAARLHQKQAGIFCRDREAGRRYLETGFTQIGMNTDLGLLRKGLEEIRLTKC